MNTDEAVVVRTYAGEMVANIAASRLGSEGVEAYIQKDDCGGAYPSLQMSGGVRLLVKAEDLEAAERILSAMEAESPGGSTAAEDQEQSRNRKGVKSSPLLPIGLFLLGLATGYFLSPELTYRSMYTGVVKKHRNPEGKPGTFYYYSDGQLIRAEEDRNYDGKMDVWYKYVSGEISSVTYDDNFDGRPDKWATAKDQFNYVEKVDTDYDGKPDVTVFYTNGLKQRRDWHPKDSPIIERRELYENGVLKETLADTDGDGIFDLRITYDRFERPTGQSKCWIPN